MVRNFQHRSPGATRTRNTFAIGKGHLMGKTQPLISHFFQKKSKKNHNEPIEVLEELKRYAEQATVSVKPQSKVPAKPKSKEAKPITQRNLQEFEPVVIDEPITEVDLRNEAVESKPEAKPVKVKPEAKDSVVIDRFKYKRGETFLRNPYYLELPEKQRIHAKFVRKLKEASSSRDEPSLKKARTSKMTPLEAQIMELKRQHPDKILAINVGYKYKFFGPDARTVSSILNIMMIPGKESVDGLNPRDQLYDKLAYCLIPDLRLHVHLKRLISQGHKVGVVEQTETAAIKSMSASKSRLFERTLTNVFTSATYIEDEGEDSMFGSKGGDCIVAILEGNEGEVSVVSVSPVNGEIVYDTFTDDYLCSELETRLRHLTPSEFVIPSDISKQTRDKITFFCGGRNSRVVTVNEVTADLQGYLMSSLGSQTSSEVISLADSLSESARACCCLLVNYLKEFGLDRSFQLAQNYHPFRTKACMLLSGSTLQSLEIFQNSTTGTEKGLLLEILDHTKTIFGFRLLKKWISRPLIERAQIEERLEAVSDVLENISSGNVFIQQLAILLGELPDLEKALSRLHYGRSRQKEVFTLLKTFNKVIELVSNGSKQTRFAGRSPLLNGLFTRLQNTCDELQHYVRTNLDVIDVQSALQNDVLSFFNRQYKEYSVIEAQQQKIREVEDALDEELGRIRKLLGRPQMEYRTVLKDEYLIEVTKITARKVPGDWIKVNETKLVVRFRSPEVIKRMKELNYERAVLEQLCDGLFSSFCQELDAHHLQFGILVRSLAEIDCLFSLAASSTGGAEDYCRPLFVDQRVISVKNGRNPIIESLVSNYIANDVLMRESEARALILTGPNMGGKSLYVRQIALIVIMAQIGCYVPADSAVLSVFDSVCTRMGFDDNIMKGESTFMVEMKECYNILKMCTDRSLVILDEVGRGTGTTDGISIAYSILDYLVTEKRAFVLFITHYTELCEIEKVYPKVISNVHMSYTEFKEREDDALSKVVFLYKVAQGYAKNLYGLNVAQLCSISEDIIQQALEISREYEKRHLKRKNLGWAMKVRQALTTFEESGAIDELKKLSDEIEFLD